MNSLLPFTLLYNYYNNNNNTGYYRILIAAKGFSIKKIYLYFNYYIMLPHNDKNHSQMTVNIFIQYYHHSY